MRKDLLDILAVALDTKSWPKEFRFHMMRWLHKTKDVQCGMTLCAGGVACYLPDFQRAGLKIEMSEDDSGFGYPVFYTTTPRYIRYTDYAAMAAVLEITLKESEWLFGPGSYYDATVSQITPKIVVSRIRSFMAGEDGPDGICR